MKTTDNVIIQETDSKWIGAGLLAAISASQVHKALSETAGIMDNEVKYPGDIL